MLQVGVEEDEIVALARLRGGYHGFCLPQVRLVPEHTETVPAGGFALGDLGRAVVGAVVDQDHLTPQVVAVERVSELTKEIGYDGSFVVGGDDDREVAACGTLARERRVH